MTEQRIDKWLIETDDQNDYIFNFGNHSGEKLSDIVLDEPDYLVWMLENDFPKAVHEIIEFALADSPEPEKE
jgi:protein involved in sex pheromone biosynthesis